MRKFVISFVLTSLLVLPLPTLWAQRKSAKTTKVKIASIASRRGVDLISADQLKSYLYFIASDEMEGRDTPSRGLDTTAEFLAMNLTRWGFKPGGGDGSFLQKIALRRDTIDRTQTQVQLNGQTLVAGDDYIPTPRAGEVSGELIFVGNGWSIKSKNLDPYKGLDARGKIAVIFTPPDGLPRSLGRSDLAGKRGEDWITPADNAQKQGVVGIVIIPDFQYLANWDRNLQRLTERGSIEVEKFRTQIGPQVPTIVASPKLANVIFQGERQSATAIFEAAFGGGEMPASFAINPVKKLSIKIANKVDPVSTQNVVAIFEGTDPILKNEYVALGAHYDHVGVGLPGVGRGPAPAGGLNDTIYNGADDDGSGTTALLAIAEALAKAPTRPKRSILFVWHCGEEKGLWGSRYFTENPTVPLDRVVTQINIDMIGRSKKDGDTNPRNKELSGPNEIYVIGSRMMSTELGDLSETVNKGYLNLAFNYRYDDPNDPNRFFFRSDHFNYARKGIPIIFFFDGEHEDYHRPGDSADKIDYQKMEKVVRTVYVTLWELATRAARPKVDKQLPFQLPEN